MNKKELRKYLKEKRSNFPLDERKVLDEEALNKLLSSDEYKESKEIFAFVSFGDEIDTHAFIKKAIKDGKNIYIPYTQAGEKLMKVTRLKNFDDLVVGHFGILSPKEEDLYFVDHNIIDLVLVPGLGFDQDGYRIGYGGGFYDRFFANLTSKPVKLGYCYDFQLVRDIPHDEFDIAVDKVLTN